MSIKQYPGGIITKNPTAPTTSSASGIWTLEQATNYIKQGIWPSQPAPPGSQSYTTAGTYSWVAPSGVTAVSVVVVGGGGGGESSAGGYNGGGGGGLRYGNNISVTPSSSYTVVVGARGNGSSSGTPGLSTSGGNSSFNALTIRFNLEPFNFRDSLSFFYYLNDLWNKVFLNFIKIISI